MSSESPRRPLPRHPSLWWRQIRWRWPILVWIAIAVLAVWLYEQGGEYIRINGMVEVSTNEVAPMEPGRLEEVLVAPGARVEPDTIVARMSTQHIDAEIALEKATFKMEAAERNQDFLSTVQRIEEELRQLRLASAEDKAESEVYRSELKRREDLVASGLLNADELVDIQVRVSALNQRLALYPKFIADLEVAASKLYASKQTMSVPNEDNDPALATQLELLKQRRMEYQLRAQHSGTVSQVRHRPGDVIDTGQSVISIVVDQPARIIAFMNESDTRPVEVDEIVEVEAAVGGPRFRARIVSISPNVLALPDRASPIPNQVVRGRRLELVPQEPLELAPGTSIVVMLPRKEMLWNSLFGGGWR